MRRRSVLSGGLTLCGLALSGHGVAAPQTLIAPGEFEPQDYIWLSWYDQGFLGSAPFSTVATEVMKAITPAVGVRLLFSDALPPYGAAARRLPVAEARQRIVARLEAAGVDTARVELLSATLSFPGWKCLSIRNVITIMPRMRRMPRRAPRGSCGTRYLERDVDLRQGAA